MPGVATFDVPQMYGKQFRLFYVEWVIGSGGAVASVLGHGFGTEVVRPHQGSVVPLFGSSYLVTMPGSGGRWELLSPIAMFAYDGVGSYGLVLDGLDRELGTIRVRTVGGNYESPATLPEGARVGLSIIASDWPHF